MSGKRKREDQKGSTSDVVAKPAAGTRVFVSGKAVKEGLGAGNRQSVVAFHQQILKPHSQLPLPIAHPTVVVIQHYLDLSPTCDEIFGIWSEADKRRDEKLVEASVQLLAQIIRILTPLPFFRNLLIGIVDKLLAPQERYHDHLCRMINSANRETTIAGLALAAAAMQVDKPDPSSSFSGGSTGRLSLRLWACLVEGGVVKNLGKLLIMRKRRKDGTADYRKGDPLDRPDMRHFCLDIISPLFCSPNFHIYTRQIMKNVYSQFEQDPPTTILRLFTSMWEAISAPSAGTGRKVALSILDERSIDAITSLFSREEVEPSTGKTVAEIASAFLVGVTTVPGRGVCFVDEGWYPRKQSDNPTAVRMNELDDDEQQMNGNREDRIRRGLHNRILSNVVRKVGGKVVDDNGRVGAWAIKLFEACPELVAGYWPNSALAIEPRLHARWMATMSYVGHIVSLPPPSLLTFRQQVPRGTDPETVPFRRLPPALETVVESILPSPLTKAHMTKGLQHADHLVQYMTAITIARCLQKLAVTQSLFIRIEKEIGNEPSTSTLVFTENPWTRRRKELEMECRRRLPEILVIISYAQKSATLAPPDAEGEVDPTLAAKSSMLTESALRLFRLYHSTLPVVAQDAKFDVGRLLVSSSSVKQERKERKEAKATGNNGSVVDETRSGVSVGTMGTAGMGGGFGYAKGNVEGFEALSQVHVLKLLGAVKGWQWTNKASASQYSYFYHILQLHLASTNPTTTYHSTALLQTLLINTPLYDHDPSELDIFLSSLPRLPAESGAAGVIQQVHFLSFIDDCVRRCTKLPYRYIDEVISLIPDYFLLGDEASLPSPLLMTILEQWVAKVGGQHISSEAAGVVARVIRRLILGTLGKMRDCIWVEAYIGKMDGVLSKLRAEGNVKEGLEGVVRDIKGDLARIKGEKKSNEAGVREGALAELLDEPEWRQTSFEWRLVHTTSENLPSVIQSLKEDVSTGTTSEGLKARYARFSALLLPSRSNIERAKLLDLISSSSSDIKDEKIGRRVKDAIFSGGWMQQAYLDAADNSCRSELDNLANVLDGDKSDQKSIAEPYVVELLKAITGDKKGKHILDALTLLYPWTRFLNPSQAQTILAKIGSHSDRLIGTSKKGKSIEVTSRIKTVLGDIAIRAKDPQLALGQFSIFLELGILDPLVNLLSHQRSARSSISPATCPSISNDSIEKLLNDGNDKSSSLLQALVLTYPSIASTASEILIAHPELVGKLTNLVVIASLLDVPCGTKVFVDGKFVAETAVAAIQDGATQEGIAEAAIDILAYLSTGQVGVVNAALMGLSTYSSRVARLLERLSKIPTPLYEQGLRLGGVWALGLRFAVDVCANLGEISSENVAMLDSMVRSLKAGGEKDLDVVLVEPVMTAIMQDRLNEAVPLSLALALVDRCEIRASFIRQHLQHLLSSPTYINLSRPSSTSSDRLPFIRVYSALFHASTYTSCQPPFIEPLLPFYRGTMSAPDRLVLGMWKTFENIRHISTSSIIIHWSPSGSVSNRAFDGIAALDSSKVLTTCTSFPIRRKIDHVEDGNEIVKDGKEGREGDDEKVYDPIFVLSLLATMMSDDTLTGLDWVEILRSNSLGLAICALSSRDEGMRDLSGYVLSQTIEYIKDKPFHERDQLQYTLLLLRHALIPHPSNPGVTPRLPSLPTLFLAHVSHAQSQPSHFLYPLTSRFLFQRPVFDAWDVPMLYTLLLGDRSDKKGEIGSIREVKRDRGWVVKFIRDGTRCEADWTLLKKRHVWEYLADMFHISVDIPFRRLILQAMESMIKIPQAARSLVHKNHLITWCWLELQTSLTSPARNAVEERGRLVGLVEGCVRACVDGELQKSGSGSGSGVKVDVKEDDGEKKKDIGNDGDKIYNALREHKERDDWFVRTEQFVILAIETADLNRLIPLSRITLLISPLCPTSTAILLPNLVDRLIHLTSSPSTSIPSTTGETNEEKESTIVQNLFSAGLAMGGSSGVTVEMGVDVAKTKKAIEEVGYRAGMNKDALGQWAGKEKRRWAWDQWIATQA